MVLSEAIILWKFILQATKICDLFFNGEMHIISKLDNDCFSTWKHLELTKNPISLGTSVRDNSIHRERNTHLRSRSFEVKRPM